MSDDEGTVVAGPAVLPGPQDAARVERRHFLRAVSRDAIGVTGTLVGASSVIGTMALRAITLERPTQVPAPSTLPPAPSTPPTRSAWRRDPVRGLLVADRLAEEGVSWLPCPDGAALVRLLARHQVGSGPALGPLGAWAMAGTARAVAHMDPMLRRNALAGTASLLRGARPASAALAAVLDAAEAAWRGDPSAPDLAEPDATDPPAIDRLPMDLATRLEALGDAHAAALASTIPALAAEAALLLAGLPPGDLLLHGALSTRASGELGLAATLLDGCRTAGIPPRDLLVTASTPTGEGLAIRGDLTAAGGRATLIADAAAASVIGTDRVAAVVVGAEWLGADGSILAPAGATTLAVLAAVHQVPYLVLGTPAVEPRPMPRLPIPRPDALAGPIADAPPLMDHVPATLITAIVRGNDPA
ncbi:MAG: hypothetical protein KF809_13105 [Chloroflexi bacterium]|nr:hypothetical protein [Chloroflexota bacterium]